jgi:hypothetical protein
VAWTSGVAGALSVANKNDVHKSTLRGAKNPAGNEMKRRIHNPWAVAEWP